MVREDNKIIAKFMGIYVHNRLTLGCNLHHPSGKAIMKWSVNNERELWDKFTEGSCYNSSWDWLMPVVEKIENQIGTFEINTTTYENKDKDYVVYCSHIERIVSHTSKIAAVYKAVVEFIKWYNENKTPCKEKT